MTAVFILLLSSAGCSTLNSSVSKQVEQKPSNHQPANRADVDDKVNGSIERRSTVYVHNEGDEKEIGLVNIDGNNMQKRRYIDPKDGVITIAFVTHTAENGFFTPAYKGARDAADMFKDAGMNIRLILEVPRTDHDDPKGAIEIIKKILDDDQLQLDVLIFTTPLQEGYEEIIKKAKRKKIRLATFYSYRDILLHRS